jgi:hypothetical protein
MTNYRPRKINQSEDNVEAIRILKLNKHGLRTIPYS